MKKGRFTEEQIIGVLKQHEAGRKIPELAREIGVSEATIYTWKSKYGGMDVNEAQRLEGLGDENRRLKHLVAGLSPDKEALKAIAQKTAGASMRRHPMSTKKLTGCCSRRSRPSERGEANPCRRAPFWYRRRNHGRLRREQVPAGEPQSAVVSSYSRTRLPSALSIGSVRARCPLGSLNVSGAASCRAAYRRRQAPLLAVTERLRSSRRLDERYSN
jgi:putative transposase